MKKRFALLLIALVLLSLFACSAPKQETPQPRITGTADAHTPERYPQESDGYFRHIAQGERTSCQNDPYSNTDADGAFLLEGSYVDGTPYSFDSIRFDPEMFAGEGVSDLIGRGDAPGSGILMLSWIFTPLSPGESEIMLVSQNLAEDTLEYRLFHITVDNSLRCALDWYEDGVIGVNCTLV